LEFNFWNRLRNLVVEKQAQSLPGIMRATLNFREQKVDAICKAILMKYPYALKEINEIAILFKQFKKDTELLCEFMIELANHIGRSLGRDMNEFWPKELFEKKHNFLQVIEQTKEALEKKHGTAIASHPFSEALYLITRSLGGGVFHQLAQDVVRS
jgi:hypothetical protein